ncbi:BTB/POZ domain-containing protein 6-B-like [Ruditapes philippinarum]|uniref:BTB/POZ domain-containing protein 6-B-like n=1 Tax=Ruditapes philippinarum TaxID=129788 RepID=UPI00295B8283|nr:BTB/POZ domain-containing protein 6-B-like [Ruditapes philippinarum]
MTTLGYDIATSLTNWRQANTASGLLEQLCMSGTLADIYFVFPSREGQQDSLPAHKFVLAMRSPAFENIFFGPDAEKQESEIIVRDIRATTFRTILRYIYTDCVEFDGNTVLHVLYAAKKYDLGNLVLECEHYLQTAIDVNNACSMFNQATFYEMDLLQAKSLEFICMNANDVFDTDDFLKLTPLSLLAILKAGNLGVEEEMDVFKAAIKWAAHHCEKKGFEPTAKNQRAWLGEALYRIRMPIIPVQQFTESVVPTGLLTNEEQVELYMHMTSHRNADADEDTVEHVGKFDAMHRPGSVFELKLPLSGTDNVKKCLTAACQILLVADKPLRLRKVTLFYSSKQYEQNIVVTVTNMKDKSFVRPRLEPVPPNGPISFAEGVYLAANTQYNIAITCMIYRGDVKALEYTDTQRGVLLNISSVFNSISSIHLSRVHST